MLGLFLGDVPLLEVDTETVVPNTASLPTRPHELQAWWRREIGQTRSQATFLSSLPEAWDYGAVDGFFFPMPSALGSFIAGSPAASGVRSSLCWASKKGVSQVKTSHSGGIT